MNAVSKSAVPGLGTTVLTEETFLVLKNMLDSTDPGDHVMAQQILVRINVRESILWIWLLAMNERRAPRMINARSKAGREFRDQSNLYGISYCNTTEFGKFLVDRGWMTPELFMTLKPKSIHRLRKLAYD